MTFKQNIQRNFLAKTLTRWIKKQYVKRIIAKKGYFVSLENSALQSELIPLYRGYCIWKLKGELKVSFNVGEYEVPASLFTEDDVQKRYPEYQNSSFQKMLNPADIPADKELIINFEFPDKSKDSIHTGWALDKKIKDEFITRKRVKLNKLEPLLKCTSCGANKLMKTDTHLTCTSCNSIFEFNSDSYNFLTGELKQLAKVEPTENISANTYDEKSLEIINQYNTGLILDNGSGLRGKYYSNVVNFEIAEYPTTDVAGVGEILPFKDESFDAAFSLNVMEHVKNPFLYAQELKRVVKKGGTIYSAVPFLQPFHGYPNHFFNMTLNGLKSLFEDTEVLDSGVVKMGHPIFGISWILDEYLNGLPTKEKRNFNRLRVSDLTKDPNKQMQKPYAKKLSAESMKIISCVNFIVCKKV